jgi:hypothetical protein
MRMPRVADSDVVLPLRGGSGALLRRRSSRRLISTLTRDDVESRRGGLVGWLERIQAWRSVLLVVPDRPTGVAIALRWRLSPEKFRLEDESGGWSRTGVARPWHSRD